MGTVVDAEVQDFGLGKALRKLQQVADGGAAEAVDALVVVAHDAKVAVDPGQAEQNPFLDAGGVLILVHHQVSDGGADAVGDTIILEQGVGPDLQAGEIQGAALLQHSFVTEAAAPEGGVEGVVRVGQALRGDALLGDALDVPAALAHRVVVGAPAAATQLVPVGAEDAVKVRIHHVQLLPFIQEREIGFEAASLPLFAQDAAAQAVHGGDADRG